MNFPTVQPITLRDVRTLSASIANELSSLRIKYIYGVPRGGVVPALMIARFLGLESEVVLEDPAMLGHAEDAPRTLIVDDICDSGKTLEPYALQGFRTAALVARAGTKSSVLSHFGQLAEKGVWIKFPWEAETETGPEDAVRRLLQYIGVDPDAPTVRETPRRVLAWMAEFNAQSEYKVENTMFEEEHYTGMVLLRDIPFVSLCEHHLLPFIGSATVAYLPDGKVLGLSKLARIVQHYARRPQMQERLTQEISNAIIAASESNDVAVLLKAEHMCMSLRGPRVSGAQTITSTLSGPFFKKRKTREEFLTLARASS